MNNEDLNSTINNIQQAWKYPDLFENISPSERILSSTVGTYLIFKGITGIFSHPVIALTGATIGAGLLYRGLTGFCPLKDLAENDKQKLVPDEVTVTETYLMDDAE